MNRLHEPRLAGARFAPQGLPATDTAAFVAASLHAMPLTYEAVMIVEAPVDEVRGVLRWGDVEFETVDDRSCRVRLRADSIEWLMTAVAMVAVRFDIEVESPPELTGRRVESSARAGPRSRAAPTDR